MRTLLNKEKIQVVLESYTDQKCYIEPLLDQWQVAKKDLFRFFGNKLTIEKEFNDTIDNDDIYNAIYKLYNELESIKLFSSIEEKEIFYDVICSLTAEEMKDNTCIQDRDHIPTYRKGMKLSKFLRSLIADRKDFIELNGKYKTSKEYFDIKYSMFNQSLTFNGVLVISIDPMDYLTMSVNNNNWQSCHSYDGCYRGGILSYMVDHVTAISYVKSKEDVTYDINYKHFTYNNKKWRSVIYISLDSLSSIHCRQYPNNNDVAVKTARKMISEQFSIIYNIPSSYTITKDSEKIQNMVTDCRNALHYNDILHSTSYDVSRLKMKEEGKEPYLIIGSSPLCPVCGDHHVDESSSLVCDYCSEETYICECCGDRIREDDIHCTDNGVYCEYCFNDNFTWCDHCQEYESNDNGQYVESIGEWVCDYCLNHYFTRCDQCGEWFNDDDIVDHDSGSYCESCFDDNFSYCEECEEYFPNKETTYYNNKILCLSCYDEIMEEEEELLKDEETC